MIFATLNIPVGQPIDASDAFYAGLRTVSITSVSGDMCLELAQCLLPSHPGPSLARRALRSWRKVSSVSGGVIP